MEYTKAATLSTIILRGIQLYYCLNVCCKACKYLKVTLEYEKLAIIWKVPVRVTRYFSMLSMFVGAK